MKHILLIEDDDVLRENTAELLELSNFIVNTAKNGKEGIQKALNNTPDIIICDIMMPIKNGHEVLKQLNKYQNTKHIPFIFLSAKTERKDVRQGMNLGADDYITKPFEEEELICAVDSRLTKVALLKDDLLNDRKVNSINELKQYFKEHGKYFNHKKEATIYKEDQKSNYTYLLTRGVVKCYKLDNQGKELTTTIYTEGDFLGDASFINNALHKETATAIKDTQIIGLPKTQLIEIINNNPDLVLKLMQLITDNITDTKNQLLQMAYSSVYKKTATTILKFANKLNKKPEEAIKISRTDLASVAGIATETLIRTLSKFKKEGLITIEGRNIKILDPIKLKEIL